ncbi:MAG: MaoC family dehydratase N-terminal domain-containing protein [Candidatus Competibacteraceae bacterium]
MNTINLQDWVGKQEEVQDHIYPTPIKALALTLNYKDFEVKEGNVLPEIWYWLYFLPIVSMAEVGTDGHPKRGGFLPPITLERRMWASSRFKFHQDLIIGEAISKKSEILKISEKTGKTGSMIFVTVKHSIQSERGVAVEEEQDIVYLPMPTKFVQPEPNPVPANLDWKEPYPIDPVLLFRFSALTFNGHKIHYDLHYATEVEKYPGLVVHGPLQALLLFESAKQHNPGRKPATYKFRGVRPVFEFDRVSICGKANSDGGHDIYTANTDGNIGMQATIGWR